MNGQEYSEYRKSSEMSVPECRRAYVKEYGNLKSIIYWEKTNSNEDQMCEKRYHTAFCNIYLKWIGFYQMKTRLEQKQRWEILQKGHVVMFKKASAKESNWKRKLQNV